MLAKAARTVGLTPEEFGEPRIKLIDQTSIMEFQIRAPSAEEAQARAAALFQAMKAKLDELRDVEASLGRVRAGSYGTCVACEAPIPFARLSAYPTAKRCHRCQAQHEKTHAGSRTPRM